jgi:hypothetical protein
MKQEPEVFNQGKMYVHRVCADCAVYSLSSSMTDVINFLEKEDPELASRARHRYSCFDRYAYQHAFTGMYTTVYY